MKLDVKADIKDVTRDLGLVGSTLVPTTTVTVLNSVSARYVQAPAEKKTASSTQVAVGLVRFKHTTHGVRTSKRRLFRRNASKNRQSVDWFWNTKGGVPGAISMISFPGRKQTKKGMRAGSHFVASGFINRTKRTGSLLAMKRKGSSRYPVEVLRVSITDAADLAFSNRINTAGAPFRREFDRLLRVKLERKRV